MFEISQSNSARLINQNYFEIPTDTRQLSLFIFNNDEIINERATGSVCRYHLRLILKKYNENIINLSVTIFFKPFNKNAAPALRHHYRQTLKRKKKRFGQNLYTYQTDLVHNLVSKQHNTWQSMQYISFNTHYSKMIHQTITHWYQNAQDTDKNNRLFIFIKIITEKSSRKRQQTIENLYSFFIP